MGLFDKAPQGSGKAMSPIERFTIERTYVDGGSLGASPELRREMEEGRRLLHYLESKAGHVFDETESECWH